MRQKYTFTLYINGEGENPEEAWNNAVDGLMEDGYWGYDGEEFTTEELDETDIDE